MTRRIKLSPPKGAESAPRKSSNGRYRKPFKMTERLQAIESGDEPLNPASDSIYQESDRLLRRTMAHLELLQTSVEHTLADGMGTPKLIKEAATVARTIAGISAELRQRQKFHKEVVENLSQDEVMELLVAMFVDMTREERRQLAVVLSEIDEESVGLLGHG